MSGQSHSLNVMFEGEIVGTIGLDAERFTFQYDSEWLKRSEAFPISLRLPLQQSAFGTAEAHPFFANLLPEGSVRIAIARRIKISADNDFALLKALGGDCAGALSINTPLNGGKAPAELGELRPLPDSIFENANDTQSVYAAVIGEGRIRLSLAGAQDKLPVFVDHNQKIYIPVGSATSNAILKVPSSTLKYLPENEVFMSLLAAQAGLETCASQLVQTGKRRSALIKRYDRAVQPDGMLKRIHQEDMCQALGVLSTRKYETEGGLSFASIYRLIQATSNRVPKDPADLLTWNIFSLLAGNADGHAKNLSILYDRSGPRLAPMYDLVCTRIYPRLDRHHAMRIGTRSDPGEIAASDWQQLANELGIGARFLIEEVRNLAERLPSAADAAAAEFRERFGPSPVVGMIKKIIIDQTKRTAYLLGKSIA